MGWADCGKDSKGRNIGYAFGGTCDFPGCTKEINRGLSYACGGMHGEDEYSCEKYFCSDHLKIFEKPDGSGDCISICPECYFQALESGYEKLLESSKEQGFFEAARKYEEVRDNVTKIIMGKCYPNGEEYDAIAALMAAEDILSFFRREGIAIN